MRGRVIGFLLSSALTAASVAPAAEGPTFDCARAAGTVEQTICGDEYLSALDRRLADVYETAMEEAAEDSGKQLRAEQRGWIQGRDECWKAQGEDAPVYFTESWKTTDVRSCVEDSYRFRIAELQVRFGMAPSRGPFSYACESDPAGGLDATYFKTDPPSALLERGDQEVIVWLVVAGSGSKYEGRNVTFWAKGREATVTWLDESLHCSIPDD